MIHRPFNTNYISSIQLTSSQSIREAKEIRDMRGSNSERKNKEMRCQGGKCFRCGLNIFFFGGRRAGGLKFLKEKHLLFGTLQLIASNFGLTSPPLPGNCPKSSLGSGGSSSTLSIESI